jgi:hypothetical protein
MSFILALGKSDATQVSLFCFVLFVSSLPLFHHTMIISGGHFDHLSPDTTTLFPPTIYQGLFMVLSGYH